MCQGIVQIGISYNNEMGVEVDKKKAKDYYELAAMNWDDIILVYWRGMTSITTEHINTSYFQQRQGSRNRGCGKGRVYGGCYYKR